MKGAHVSPYLMHETFFMAPFPLCFTIQLQNNYMTWKILIFCRHGLFLCKVCVFVVFMKLPNLRLSFPESLQDTGMDRWNSIALCCVVFVLRHLHKKQEILLRSLRAHMNGFLFHLTCIFINFKRFFFFSPWEGAGINYIVWVKRRREREDDVYRLIGRKRETLKVNDC